MAKKVEINFSANAEAFHKVAEGVKDQIGHIKTALMTGLGIGAVAEMVSSAIDFTKETKRGADELGVSFDRARQLGHIMESLGKDSHVWVMAMGKVQDYMQDAYNNAYKMSQLKLFGITEEDFQNFDFDKILRKALEASKAMPRAQAQMFFNDFFGPKVGSDILYKREQILAPTEASGITEKQIQETLELSAKFKELKEAISILILRGLVPFMEVLTGSNKKRYEKYATDLAAEVAAERSNKGLKDVWDTTRYYAEALLEPQLTFGPESNKMDALKAYVRRMSGIGKNGEEIFNKVWAEFEKNLPKGTDILTQPVSTGPDIRPKSVTSPSFSTNPFLQIGGLMGVDTAYRLNDLAERTANASERTATATERIVGLMTPQSSATPPQPEPLPTTTPSFRGRGAGGKW